MLVTDEYNIELPSRKFSALQFTSGWQIFRFFDQHLQSIEVQINLFKVIYKYSETHCSLVPRNCRAVMDVKDLVHEQ